jgi:hypothetical protein
MVTVTVRVKHSPPVLFTDVWFARQLCPPLALRAISATLTNPALDISSDTQIATRDSCAQDSLQPVGFTSLAPD